MFLLTKHPHKLLKDAIETILRFGCSNFRDGRLLAKYQFYFRDDINDELAIAAQRRQKSRSPLLHLLIGFTEQLLH
jgi:hypothetical protein